MKKNPIASPSIASPKAFMLQNARAKIASRKKNASMLDFTKHRKYSCAYHSPMDAIERFIIMPSMSNIGLRTGTRLNFIPKPHPAKEGVWLRKDIKSEKNTRNEKSSFMV